MYWVQKGSRQILESDACGIGFVASRKGVADRQVVLHGLDMCRRFDHRGAPGHGAGIQVDIPWPMLLDRFPDHAKAIAQRDVALGMFFLPFDPALRGICLNKVEQLAELAGISVLAWQDVPVDPTVLGSSHSLRTLPIVRQALFRRPSDMSEDGWFAARYLLRLALDSVIGQIAGDEFSVVSLSNRTVVYKGLFELSRIAEFYPDLQNEDFASRFLLFHSRYSTNTTTAWRRAQPFWALAHNGEISTIRGNVAWFEAIGKDLLASLIDRHPALSRLAQHVTSVVCAGGSDTANLDDMLIALLARGLDITSSLLALLPEANTPQSEVLGDFYRSMSVYLGACDGPAALVACDGDEAVAHLDRNGLRPLWFATTKDYAVAASELTGVFPNEGVETQFLLGPGETVRVKLGSGDVALPDQIREEVAREFERTGLKVPNTQHLTPNAQHPTPDTPFPLTPTLPAAFGMTKEDLSVVLEPLFSTGKPAIGSMGDDTPPSAMLDRLPRRIEDHFALRFAQETSPPIDPIRDAWVFDSSVALGDRAGLFSPARGDLHVLPERIFSPSDLERLGASLIDLTFDPRQGASGIDWAIRECVDRALRAAHESSVLILSDQAAGQTRAPLPTLRVISQLHQALIQQGARHRVGLVVDAGLWDIHHCALHIALGADAVCPRLGCELAGENQTRYLKGIRAGVIEAMSMMGVTPASAYCGASLVEAIGLDSKLLAAEFPGVPGHLGGITAEILNREWFDFWQAAYDTPIAAPEPRAAVATAAVAGKATALLDAGEYRHTKDGRPHANNAEIVRLLHSASGYTKKIHRAPPGTFDAYRDYADLVRGRDPINVLDLLTFKNTGPIPIDEVESEAEIAWRFMAPGMSEGALSEPAHRTVAEGLNLLHRWCRIKGVQKKGMGPFANSGEGGFDKDRIGRRDGNPSIQYAGGRFTITPMTAARAKEAEVKFAQGAKPGKGGQLPGKKVSVEVAQRRGCEPGYELVSPPINHNLYSIEDVKLMIESWRHLNPRVNCALKYVATHGVEMVAIGGVNAGANRLHISDGCGGTGAAKRVDQKHAGVPVAVVLPKVQDLLAEEGVRHLIELSVDGGVQTGTQALKLFLLGADRVGFGTSLLVAIGCSMLRKCHLAGPDPADPTGQRRLGCTPGVATQDPVHIAKFSGKAKHIARYLIFVAREVRELMAEHGIKRLDEVVGRRDLLDRKPDLHGKAALLDLSSILSAPHARTTERSWSRQSKIHMPKLREQEVSMARLALEGKASILRECLTNEDRCVGVGAAGEIARAAGDLGLPEGSVSFDNKGAAGHFYAAYSVDGLNFRMKGLVADSCFTAAYGGTLAILPAHKEAALTLVGNTFGYGARGGHVYIAGRAGNRFGICLRKSAEGTGIQVVVEGVGANAFQYMTGGVALVLGSTGPNLGAGMTGGTVYLLDADLQTLNKDYVKLEPADVVDRIAIEELLAAHVEATTSIKGQALQAKFDVRRFSKVTTRLIPESLE